MERPVDLFASLISAWTPSLLGVSVEIKLKYEIGRFGLYVRVGGASHLVGQGVRWYPTGVPRS